MIEKIGGEPGWRQLGDRPVHGIIRVALKHGCLPFGDAKARAVAWNLPDPVPVHRRADLYLTAAIWSSSTTLDDRRDFRVAHLGKSIQAKDVTKDFPIILTSGRLVEYEGGGEETRSNKWWPSFSRRSSSRSTRRTRRGLASRTALRSGSIGRKATAGHG